MSFIRLDKVRASAHYESVLVEEGEYFDGQFFNLGKSLDEDGEVVKGHPVAKGEGAHAILCRVHIDYGVPHYDIREQSTSKGEVGRVLIFADGDMVGVTNDASMNIVEGDKVSIGKDGFGFKKLEDGEVQIGECIRKDFVTNIGELNVIRFVKDVKAGGSGEQGAQGLPGKDGLDGKQGIQGKPGVAGKDGIDGKQGIQGLPGKDGVDGKQGIQGLPGKDGTNGTDGLQGEKGETGAPGKDGTNGKVGTAGKNGTDGSSVASLAFTLGEDGKITGGTATLSNGESIPVEIK